MSFDPNMNTALQWANALGTIRNLPSSLSSVEKRAELVNAIEGPLILDSEGKPSLLPGIETKERSRRQSEIAKASASFMPDLSETMRINIALRLWSGCLDAAKTIALETMSGPNTPSIRTEIFSRKIDEIAQADGIYLAGVEAAPAFKAMLNQRVSFKGVPENSPVRKFRLNRYLITNSIKAALLSMDSRYASLSDIVNGEAEETERVYTYQERPYAYEFYHQLRKMIEEQKLELGGHFVQPEINKTYQHYLLNEGKIPDFIIHVPNSKTENLCVIEFKRAKSGEINGDLKKLVEFKDSLRYQFLFEVIVGKKSEVKDLKDRMKSYAREMPQTEIAVISFNIDSWQADDWLLQY
jgi:hypothetical protein